MDQKTKTYEEQVRRWKEHFEFIVIFPETVQLEAYDAEDVGGAEMKERYERP